MTPPDVGFMLFTSFGNGYRLTGNPAYRQVLLTTAGSLATRYSPVVRMIRSWNNARSAPASDFQVILDNMMNLNLLWWGGSQPGGNGAWLDEAVNHSTRTIADFIRPDGSSYHVVIYDSNTGAIKSKQGGYNINSTISRVHAWGIYGFTEAYQATHTRAFLTAAEELANYFLSHTPADGIPYWDFSAPEGASTPRDSSAAAITASALIELSQDVQAKRKAQRYLGAAKHILSSLSSPAYLSRGTSNAAILLQGTSDGSHGISNVGLSYGNYYFIEALLRYQQLESEHTKITKAKIRSRRGRASFAFKLTGGGAGLQCALVRPHKRHKKARPTFSACRSPKTYAHLKPGIYGSPA